MSKFTDAFKDRFAQDDEIGGTGAYVLKSDGCFLRHSTPRNEQYRTAKEDRNSNSVIEYKERQMMNMIWDLRNKGIKLTNDEMADMLNNPEKYEER